MKLTGTFYGERFEIIEEDDEFSINCDNAKLFQLTDTVYNPNTGAIERMNVLDGIEEAYLVLNSLSSEMDIEFDEIPEDIILEAPEEEEDAVY